MSLSPLDVSVSRKSSLVLAGYSLVLVILKLDFGLPRFLFPFLHLSKFCERGTIEIIKG